MRVVEFLRLLDDGIRLRVRFVIESGVVVQFTVQLEWLSGGRWIGLVRYDTAHGFAHCDTPIRTGNQNAPVRAGVRRRIDLRH